MKKWNNRLTAEQNLTALLKEAKTEAEFRIVEDIIIYPNHRLGLTEDQANRLIKAAHGLRKIKTSE